MVSSKVKMTFDRIAWSYSIISVIIVIITFISYNIIQQIPLGIETWLYWLFIIIAIIYPTVYVIRIVKKRSTLTRKVGDLLKNNEQISAYQAAKILEEPLWLVKNVFNKWKKKPGVVVKIGGDLIYFNKKIVNLIKELYQETEDLGKISLQLNKQKIVLKKSDIQIIIDELLDKGDEDVLLIEEERHGIKEKEDI
ncbi:MAG: hypothetical protein EAX96_08430 [Candidatus Lokiarchaeota archaeon]|nr:hypothetical protein [Candidatus Lokiarchaeota archaeon]